MKNLILGLFALIATAVTFAFPAMAELTVERWSYKSSSTPTTYTAALRVCDGLACTIEKPGERIALDQKKAVAWVQANYAQKTRAVLIDRAGNRMEPGDANGDGVVSPGEVVNTGPDQRW